MNVSELSELGYRLDAALIVVAFLLVLIAVAELGFREGKKRTQVTQNGASDIVQQGLLTLLALLLAFGVSMAELRFEERNSILIEEAAAIGTTSLRSALFSEEFHQKFQALIDQYLDVRIAWYKKSYVSGESAAIQSKTLELQNRLWSVAADLSRHRPTAAKVPTVTMSLLLASLNQTIDLQSKQDFAYERRVPRSIIYLLFLISTLVVGMVGFSHGVSGSRHAVLTSMMSVVLALTLFVILDLSRPERGLIRLNPKVLIELKKNLNGR